MSSRTGRSLDDVVADAVTPDVRDAAWYRFAAHVRDVANCPEYAWASDLLAGILATVERTHVVTDKQRRAVERVRDVERSPSRAYDGTGHFRRDH